MLWKNRQFLDPCAKRWELSVLLFLFEYNYDNKIFYPLTQWGDNYTRWDSELKKFCEREFLKVD